MNTATKPAGTSTAGNAPHLAGKYLTFRLHGEEYGLPIMRVQEIIGLLPVTSIPCSPRYVRGVVNLRGRIIPTIDLRSKFQLPATKDTSKSCIVVVEVGSSDGKLSLGLIADEVAEVLNVDAAHAAHVSSFAGDLPMEYVLGMGVVNDSVKILLDIDRVMSFDELSVIHANGKSPAAATGKAA